LTTTHAHRTQTNVVVDMRGRFPLCGGWKSDWDQGYSVPSKYYLNQGVADSDLFKLVMPIMHAYENILAENYTISVTLPLGATDIKVTLNPI
jgi:hypothetical protein